MTVRPAAKCGSKARSAFSSMIRSARPSVAEHQSGSASPVSGNDPDTCRREQGGMTGAAIRTTPHWRASKQLPSNWHAWAVRKSAAMGTLLSVSQRRGAARSY